MSTRESRDALANLKAIGEAHGYRFEIDAEGTHRMYRPDGSLAMVARPQEGNAGAMEIAIEERKG